MTIIKVEKLHIPPCQAFACRYYFPAGGVLKPSFCDRGYARPWPCMVKLEDYQVRLSRLLVLRRLGRIRGCRHWEDGLFHAGRVL